MKFQVLLTEDTVNWFYDQEQRFSRRKYINWSRYFNPNKIYDLEDHRPSGFKETGDLGYAGDVRTYPAKITISRPALIAIISLAQDLNAYNIKAGAARNLIAQYLEAIRRGWLK